VIAAPAAAAKPATPAPAVITAPAAAKPEAAGIATLPAPVVAAKPVAPTAVAPAVITAPSAAPAAAKPDTTGIATLPAPAATTVAKPADPAGLATLEKADTPSFKTALAEVNKLLSTAAAQVTANEAAKKAEEAAKSPEQKAAEAKQQADAIARAAEMEAEYRAASLKAGLLAAQKKGDELAQKKPGDNYVFQPAFLSASGVITPASWHYMPPQSSGGGGFFGGIFDKIGSGISDFVSDPAKATTNFFDNPGVKEAALITAAAYGLPALSELAAGTAAGTAGTTAAMSGGFGAGAAEAGLSGLATGGAGAAALTPAAIESLAGTAGYGASAAAGAGSGAGAYLAGLEGTGAALGVPGVTSGGTLSTAVGNEAVASGMAPGSLGAKAAASGLLTPAQLAAASGSSGLSSLTGASTAATNLAKSANEAVASGLSPGSAGAAQAAAGTLTAEQLAAAAGTNTSGITDLLKDASKVKDVVKTDKSTKSTPSATGTAGALGLAALLAAANKGKGTDNSYQGTIPEYVASRTQNTMPTKYRPGQGGITYFNPVAYQPKMAEGGQVTDGQNNYPVSGYPSREGGNGWGGEGAIGQGGIAPQGPLPQLAGLGSLGGNPLMPPSDQNIKDMQNEQKGIAGLYGGDNSPFAQYTIGGNSLQPSMQNPSSQQNVNMADGGEVPGQYNLGSYSDGGRLLQGPGDGVSDSIPAIIGHKQPARLATGEFVIPARIVSELGNGSTDAGAKRLYEMMKRVQQTRRKTKNVAANTNAAKYLPA
jgi:hypothetical protein